MTFTSEPPVLADRINVGGKQWIEPISSTQCRVLQQTEVSVRIFGVGGQVEQALGQSIQDSCAGLPRSAEAYVTLRRKNEARRQKPAEAAPAAGSAEPDDAIATGEVPTGGPHPWREGSSPPTDAVAVAGTSGASDAVAAATMDPVPAAAAAATPSSKAAAATAEERARVPTAVAPRAQERSVSPA